MRKVWLIVVALLLGAGAMSSAQAPAEQLDFCHGASYDMQSIHGTPRISVDLAGSKGPFVLDWGATQSSFDVAAYSDDALPVPWGHDRSNARGYWFPSIKFLWIEQGPVQMLALRGHVKDGSGQAGIIGTDFLSENVYTLEYGQTQIAAPNAAVQGHVRANSADFFCSDDVLLREGFRSVSVKGTYSSNLSSLGGRVNVPELPVQIGDAGATAQFDTGFSKYGTPYAVVINKAFLAQMQSKGINLTDQIQVDPLSSCIDDKEPVKAYRLPTGVNFIVNDDSGHPLIKRHDDVLVLLKDPPEKFRSCGGIGFSDQPKAQFGGDFLTDAQKIVIDPFKARMWFWAK